MTGHRGVCRCGAEDANPGASGLAQTDLKPDMPAQEAHVFVHGEDEICAGDIATLEIKFFQLA